MGACASDANPNDLIFEEKTLEVCKSTEPTVGTGFGKQPASHEANATFSPTELFRKSYTVISKQVPVAPKQPLRSNQRTIHSGTLSPANANREILWTFSTNKFSALDYSALQKSPIELKRISNLHRDQALTKTSMGVEINKNVSTKIMTRKQLEKLRANAPSPDMMLISKPPFSNVDRIVPGVYLTAVTGLLLENLRERTIRLIINATHELPLLKSSDFVTFRVPVEDSEEDRSIAMYLEDVADLIEMTRQEGCGTIVHCMGGISRSTTLVLAYLIKYTNLNLHEAFRHVHSIRPVVRPNATFLGLLRDFEIRLHKQPSFQFVITGDCKVPDFYETEFPDLFMAELNRQRVNFTQRKEPKVGACQKRNRSKQK